MPKSLRLIVPLLILLAGLVLIFTQYHTSLRYETRHTEQDTRNELNAAGHRMAGMAQYLLSRGDLEGLKMEVGLMAPYPDLQLAVVVDAENRILQSTDPRWRGRNLDETPLAGSLAYTDNVRRAMSSQIIESSSNTQMTGVYAFPLPVKHGSLQSQGAGLVIIGLDLQSPLQAMQGKVWSMAAASAGLVLLVASLLWFLLHRFLGAPVQQLVARTRAFAAGNYTTADKAPAIDELGEISEALDKMAITVRDRENALQEEAFRREKIQATNYRLAKIVEQSVNEIHVFDSESFQFLNVNRSARENLGYSSKEVEHMTPMDIAPEFDRTQFDKVIQPLLDETEDIVSFETTYQRKDGSTYPVETALCLLRTESPPVFAALSQDITERKQQLASLLLRDRAMSEVDIGLVITDAKQEDNPVVYVNPALEKMTGYDKSELIGHNLRLLQGTDQYQPGAVQIRSALSEGTSVTATLRNYRKDGTQFVDEVSISPVHDEHGNLTHHIGIQRDITSRLETDARLQQAQKMDAVGQLSGGIAHDFNNILSVISGNLEFLEMESTDDSLKELVEEAQSATQMGARLTRRLLTFASQGSLEPTTVNLNEQLNSSIELLQSTIGEHISLCCDMATELWQTKVDPSGIENTVVNLAINARDAMPDGGSINFTTSNISIEEDALSDDIGLVPGDYVKLSVADNGSGMSDEVKKHIFEPFYTTKAIGKGTGLGLASVYGFVKQSGGQITVYSEVGIGTTFNIYLPRYKTSPDTSTNTQLKSELNMTNTGRILVVEDNEMVLKVTAKRLRRLGYDIHTASNGPEAIKILENEPDIDLILSDIVMDGGMSGYDVAAWARKNQLESKILLTSGFNEAQVEQSAVFDKNLDVLQKPYSMAELQAAVNEKLHSKTGMV